ncbi:MAG: hypothetical protein PHY15_00160 [Eubacteriales bacterium]|nr:hypothetical protein [Eubacteriales bacterium]MDD4475521.1 hypothetical protein [Eubacteriales bacterium]
MRGATSWLFVSLVTQGLLLRAVTGGGSQISTTFLQDSGVVNRVSFSIIKNQTIKNQNQSEVTLMPSGGYRPGAGRPRKNPIDKKLEGKATGTNSVSQPKPKKFYSKNVMTEYFSMAMKECEKEVPSAEVLRNEIEEFIAARGCGGYVAPQTITDYVLNRQGFLACEAMNRKIGRMTKELKLSPYVTAGSAYYKAMQGDFNLIMQIINRYSSNQTEEKNAFLELLTNRGF